MLAFLRKLGHFSDLGGTVDSRGALGSSSRRHSDTGITYLTGLIRKAQDRPDLEVNHLF